ncbi:acyl-CoA dehydrogenase family protein [Roseiarcaceae bacterium H3SJ34-1]|uniref:acyl-CoA dehydrogenase family protein n=1 Tax=Terripilifer ovatus TaxID=3032367 RepID=UPI003AB96746|nr:acyl-CoA dehydrogenase family protein [Roseiarcaceae bacterium H3SJ34-1]
MATLTGLQSQPDEFDIAGWARDFVPELRAAQSESDRLARPPRHIAEKLKAAGVYRLTVPKVYGGLQATTKTYMETVTELGRGDAGVAWAVTLVAACNWTVASYFRRHVVDEVFSKPNACVAGVFSGRGCQARKVEGGIHVDKGIWFFNSGVYEADWDLLGVPMFDKNGESAGPGIALVPMSDVKLLNDWNTSGIRGSGSTNVMMENVFIPDDRIVSLVSLTDGSQPQTFPEAFANTAFSPMMVNILTYPIMGLGMHMIETFLETLPKRDIKLTFYNRSAEAPVTHLQIGEASAKIDAARLITANVVKEMDDWAASEDYMPQLLRARLCRDSAFANSLVWEAVDLLATASGGSFAWLSNVANRIWQDVKVGTMHPFVSVPSNFEMYGRMVAGIKPPLMLV